MRKHLDFVVSAYVAVLSLTMLATALGEALTGGMRLDARPVVEMVDPLNALALVLWLAGSFYLAARRLWGREA